jgi:aspartate aminotransferase-like enzyme
MTNQRIRFFLPGPTWVRNDVLHEMERPMIGHRSAAFKELYQSLQPKLQSVFRTHGDVLMATGSATLAMESAVVSSTDGNILHLTCGAFSERWAAVSASHGKRADRLDFPWGRAVDPDLLRQTLKRKSYGAVTVVHNETSTGVINPLQQIAEIVRSESDALILVDTVSSLAGAQVEVDAWGLDIVLTSTQKALAVPPGITLFSLSERAAKHAAGVRNRGFYTDVLRYRDKHQASGTITTPAISILYALDRQLDVILDEGMEARWNRHLALKAMVAKWASENDFSFASQEGHPASRDHKCTRDRCQNRGSGFHHRQWIWQVEARDLSNRSHG